MEHRGIEFTIVQGIERGRRWKWTVTMDARRIITGLASSRAEAEREAIRAIGKALVQRKVKLVSRGG